MRKVLRTGCNSPGTRADENVFGLGSPDCQCSPAAWRTERDPIGLQVIAVVRQALVPLWDDGRGSLFLSPEGTMDIETYENCRAFSCRNSLPDGM